MLSKFDYNYKKQAHREARIQKKMKEKGFNRVQAVHNIDFEDQKRRETGWSK